MSTPFDSFQQGLMTGGQIGGQLRERRNARQIGGMLQSGDMTGARNTAFGQGDLRTGLALDGQVREQASAERGQQLTGALAEGNFDQALSFAQTPQELQAITEFRDSASEAERTAAVQRSEQLAMVVGSIMSLPPEQQFAAAQQAAQRMGMDPNSITPEMVTPQALDAMRMQALGLKDYLEFKQDERDASMPRYVPALGGFIMPPGASPTTGQQPQSLGSTLPPGWTPQPRPNQPPSAPAAGGGERSQQPRISFQSSGEARQAVAQMVPGVRVTNADRTPADTARIRRQGYNPSETSFHLKGQALDLTPPAGMSMAQLEAKMRQAGFRVLNEGHHIHVSW